MNLVLEKTDELAALLKDSTEYKTYLSVKERVMVDAGTKAMLDEYIKLQYKLQAASISGCADEAELIKLQKLGELLQLNPDASEYLFAQYRLNSLLTEVYSRLGKAVGIDIGMLEG